MASLKPTIRDTISEFNISCTVLNIGRCYW